MPSFVYLKTERVVLDGAVTLRDGRTLAYAVWGSPDGAPIVYCHGSPGNRWEIKLPLGIIANQGLAVRVVALNRPGFGPSTFLPQRSLLDWPADVTEVVDHLGIGRFAVLGASGGGPYALACGHELADRVTRIGLVVGGCPAQAPGMGGSLALAGPPRNPLIRRIQYGLIAWAVRSGRVERVVDRAIETMGEADRAAMADPRLRGWLSELFAEAFVDGGRGAAYEHGLYLADWGFLTSAVTQPTWLWYGGKDRNIPAEAGRWLADHLPNAHYSVWPEHGHFTWAISQDVIEVLATMAAAERGI